MGETKDLKADFLFATPSFLSGIARLFDLLGRFDYYNVSRSPEEADARATYSDWRIVGQDLRDAYRSFDQEQESRQHKLFTERASKQGVLFKQA